MRAPLSDLRAVRHQRGLGCQRGLQKDLFRQRRGPLSQREKERAKAGRRASFLRCSMRSRACGGTQKRDGTLEEPCGEPTSAEPSAETVLLLSSLLSAERNEPNTRLEHVLACVESVPSLVLCQPLLQSVQETLGSEYWLLDSGASSCVVTRKSLEQLHHDEIVPCGALFTAANGAPVPFLGRCSVVLRVRTRDEKGVIKDGVCRVPVMVGDTPYNILSTSALGRLGWRVVLDEGVHVSRVRTPVEMIDTCIWCDTPWIKVLDSSGHDQMLALFEEDVCEQDVATSASVGHVAVLSRRTQEELEVHRTKGHVPFHPDCEHCVKSRGVNRHRRRLEHGLETEIVADFMYLSAVGESVSVVDQQTDDSFKVLVLRESFSSCVGAIVMTENVSKDRALLMKWLAEFGLFGASDRYTFLVRKAAPQAHEQIGGAERTVRVLKEGLATLQSDFQELGFALVFRRDLVQLVLTYLCMSGNANDKAFGGERAPKEIASGRRLPEAAFALFGSKVLAEVPESVKNLCPNMSRFVAAAYLHPQFGSLGSLVFAYVRVGQELVPKAFVAKSFKLVYPIEIVFGSGMFSVLKIRGEQGPRTPGEHPVAPRILPSAQGASLKCPSTGPPKEFFERFGPSDGCRACDCMLRLGSRKGLSHGRACCDRYEAWLRSQLVEESAGEPPAHAPAPEVVQDALATLEEAGEAENAQDGSEVPLPSAKKLRREPETPSAELPERSVASREHSCARTFTRGCPSCESGMNAPGIRHNTECKRRNQEVRFQEGEQGDVPGLVPVAPSAPSEALEMSSEIDHDVDMPMEDDIRTEPELTTRSVKRSSEVPVEKLEEEMRQGVNACVVQVHNCETGNDIYMPLSSFVEQAFQVTQHVPLLSGLLDSVQFAPNATSVVVPFGKRSHLRVWRPRSAVDDSTLSELPGDEVMEGMLKEVNNLSHMETGDLLTASELQALEKKFPGTLRVIPSRWVTTQKTPTTVRARIVIKDVAGKSSGSARSLGISSPTPSADALFTVLGIAGCRDLVLSGGDVSHAFMATPLRERDVVMKFPLSVSTVSGEPLYLHLRKALNGLRKASQEWICFVADVVKSIGSGLRSCSLEPCLFSGLLESGPCILLVYV